MSTEVRFVKIHWVKQTSNLLYWGWMSLFQCIWLEKEWSLLLVDSFVLELKELWQRASWTNERGGKISRLTFEILGMNCTLKGFWWVNGCFIQLSHCQVTQDITLLCFARMEFSRWCAIVIFRPWDAIRMSKTSYKDVSCFGILIFANGFWEVHTKIDLIVFQMRNLVK